MPVDEVHGSIISRTGAFSKIYADGFIHTDVIKESNQEIILPDVNDIPAHKKHGECIATSLYGLAVYEDKFVLAHTTINQAGAVVFCCGSGGGCNPVYEICP